MMNLFENLQKMNESTNLFDTCKNIPVIVTLSGGTVDNLRFTLDQLNDNDIKNVNALVSDLTKYKLDNKDVVTIDKGSISGENQQYYKTINALLDNAVLLTKHDTILGKSSLYNYNGKTFLRTYDPEYGLDVYNLPKELFDELTKTESPKMEMGALNKSKIIPEHISYNPTINSEEFKKVVAIAQKIYNEDSNSAIKIIEGITKVLELDIKADINGEYGVNAKSYYWKNYIDELEKCKDIVPDNIMQNLMNLVA